MGVLFPGWSSGATGETPKYRASDPHARQAAPLKPKENERMVAGRIAEEVARCKKRLFGAEKKRRLRTKAEQADSDGLW